MKNDFDMRNVMATSFDIYAHLADAESKAIYTNRILYSMTGEVEYIRNIIKSTGEGKKFFDQLNKKQVNFIFGAGSWGSDLSQIWKEYWNGFLDNNRELWNRKINGLLVTAPISKIDDSYTKCQIFIGTRLYYKEIEKQLLDLGQESNNIINIGKVIDFMAQRQYFDLIELPHAANEVFVDVGSFDGNTAVLFADWSKQYKHIYCFEPDKKNLKKCQMNLSTLENKNKITLINKGIWSDSGVLHFDAKGNGSSSVTDSGDEVVVTTLDDEMIEKNVTFIKMDIEGAEIEALKGAAKVISGQKPKLAISIYHKLEDIVEIPQILLKYNPDYHFYLRHYSLAAAETVLYAI